MERWGSPESPTQLEIDGKPIRDVRHSRDGARADHPIQETGKLEFIPSSRVEFFLFFYLTRHQREETSYFLYPINTITQEEDLYDKESGKIPAYPTNNDYIR